MTRAIPMPSESDDEVLRQAGTLTPCAAEIVSASAQVGLEHRALVLGELRASTDDRCEALYLLAFSLALVRVKTAPTAQVRRPAAL